MIKHENHIYNIVWNITGTPDNPEADVPGGDLSTTFTIETLDHIMQTLHIAPKE